MQLTDKQAQQLRIYAGFRTSPPTLTRYIMASWHSYLYLTGMGVLAISVFIWAGWPIASAFFAGLVLATFWRDLRWYNELIKGWSLRNEITNWHKVDELLKTSGTDHG